MHVFSIHAFLEYSLMYYVDIRGDSFFLFFKKKSSKSLSHQAQFIGKERGRISTLEKWAFKTNLNSRVGGSTNLFSGKTEINVQLSQEVFQRY